MTDSYFANICEKATQELRNRAPKKTGNLAYNGVQLVFVSNREALLYVDESIAPYMPYTNEPWVADRWKGKPNPNEGWFDRAADGIAQLLNDLAGGKLKSVDY